VSARLLQFNPYVVDERHRGRGTVRPLPDDLSSLDASALIALWRARSAVEHGDPASFARLASRLLAVGEPLVAQDRA
jgi:hypothetical protein